MQKYIILILCLFCMVSCGKNLLENSEVATSNIQGSWKQDININAYKVLTFGENNYTLEVFPENIEYRGTFIINNDTHNNELGITFKPSFGQPYIQVIKKLTKSSLVLEYEENLPYIRLK